MQQILKVIAKYFSIDYLTVQNLLLSFILLLVFLLTQMISKYLLSKKIKDIYTKHRFIRFSRYFIVFILCASLIKIWLKNFQIGTFLGLISAGLAIALKDYLINITAWIFIILRRPFDVGDRVEIGNEKGDVIDLKLFQFTMLEIGNRIDAEQSTGRIVHIPNGKIFTESIKNYYKGFYYIWNEVPVLLTFESDWKLAQKILIKIAERNSANLSEAAQRMVKSAAKKYPIQFEHFSPIIYVSTRESGILLTLRFLVEPRKSRLIESHMWTEILEEIGVEKNIDFAYRTIRSYQNFTEGKHLAD